MDVSCSSLDNGVRVVSAQMPALHGVTVGIWADVGSRCESRAMSGASHFVEHLLFKGTNRRTPLGISQEIEGRGGYLNAFTQEESTCYYARVPGVHLSVALDVLSDMYMNSTFSPSELDRERGVILEEIMMYRDQPNQLVQELLNTAMWTGHPLGRPVIGCPRTIRNMSRDAIVSFKDSRYTGRNTVLAFAGNIEHALCVDLAETYMKGIDAGRRTARRHVTDAVVQDRVRLESKDIEQTHLAIGFRLFGRHDTRRHALTVLNAVLGENMSSRLFQVVRERHGLAYAVHSSVQLFDETGALTIYAGVDRRRALKAVGLITREVDRLRKRRIAPRELQRAKDYLTGQLELSLESSTQQMMRIGDCLLSFGSFIHPSETIARIRAVSADEVCSVADDALRGEHASIAMVAPGIADGEAVRLSSVLESL